jgi:hypothetical protein
MFSHLEVWREKGGGYCSAAASEKRACEFGEYGDLEELSEKEDINAE